MLAAMSLAEFAPSYVEPAQLFETLRKQGFAVAAPSWVAELAQSSAQELAALAPLWDDLPSDPYLRDGGHYRRRRHGSFLVSDGTCEQVAHRPHFQSAAYNSLHGGMLRWFEPLPQELTERRAWSHLLTGLAALFGALRPAPRWYVEAHQFRIDTRDGIGRPTPEGAHRDGVDFVALFLIDRRGIRGGETRVFDAAEPHGLRFTLRQPWSVLLLDDQRVIHESTPILPEGGELEARACAHEQSPEGPARARDTLVLTYRREGFQEPRGGEASSQAAPR
jgi:hypothetical protein